MAEALNVLFVCPNNATRSIFAEALLNRVGQGRFRVFSAGPEPRSAINPYVAETLRQVGCDTSEQYPKSWDKFVTPNAPRLDVVITLADSLHKRQMPIWYSNPVLVHWHITDPEPVEGDEVARISAYRRCYGTIEQQMLKLAGLNTETLHGESLGRALNTIKP